MDKLTFVLVNLLFQLEASLALLAGRPHGLQPPPRYQCV